MSKGLSIRHLQMKNEGRHLTDDSKKSEKILHDAMKNVIMYAEKRFANISDGIIFKDKITLYECQTYFANVGGPQPNPRNKKVFMKPDGGILFAKINNKEVPILITEDKLQGTNDNKHENNQKRQATGNAIERGAKNIRGAEMIFADNNIFPYVIFAAGCDFHSSETIAKRLEMMNMGIPNHYIELSPHTSEEDINCKLKNALDTTNITKVCGKSIASIYVKAHKWDEMRKGSSMWTKEEYTVVCCNVVDLVAEYFESIIPSVKPNT